MGHGRVLETADFSSANLRDHRHLCRQCESARMKRYREAHPSKTAWHSLLKRMRRAFPNTSIDWKWKPDGIALMKRLGVTDDVRVTLHWVKSRDAQQQEVPQLEDVTVATA
jgi:hypothetical protein